MNAIPKLSSRTPTSGYAFQFTGKRRWLASSSEYYEIVCIDADPAAVLLGQRQIDGTTCLVWRSRGAIVAQTKVGA